MKKIMMKLFLFSCTVFLIFGNQIDKNKKRIHKITKKGDRNFYLLYVGFLFS